MVLDNSIVKKLAKIFFLYFPTDEDKKLAMCVYKIIDFSYDIPRKELTYLNGEYEKIFLEGDFDFTENDFSITPVPFSLFDMESVITAINQIMPRENAYKLSPLFDSIGWVLRYEVNNFNIHFIGSPNYEVWKEPIIPWNYDLEEDACDWKSGDDWRDGFNLERDLPPNWKETDL